MDTRKEPTVSQNKINCNCDARKVAIESTPTGCLKRKRKDQLEHGLYIHVHLANRSQQNFCTFLYDIGGFFSPKIKFRYLSIWSLLEHRTPAMLEV